MLYWLSLFTGQQYFYFRTKVWSKMAEGKPKAAFIKINHFVIHIKYLQPVRNIFAGHKKRKSHMVCNLYRCKQRGQV